jgi:hypothetical protein
MYVCMYVCMLMSIDTSEKCHRGDTQKTKQSAISVPNLGAAEAPNQSACCYHVNMCVCTYEGVCVCVCVCVYVRVCACLCAYT